MSRSIGHRPWDWTDSEIYYNQTDRNYRPWHHHRGAWAWHTGHDLRYTRSELEKAAREGRRAVPEEVRPWFVAYNYGRGGPRTWGSIPVYVKKYNRSARTSLRRELAGARRTANTRKDFEFDRTMDVVPYRPRRRGLWDAT